ncbi:MAG: hypothetical protein SFU55_10955 [Methylophilus sp.]|nr:hypothetical protein [Methylophilus sp.]
MENQDLTDLQLMSAEDFELIQTEHERLHRYISNLEETCIHLQDGLTCNSCDREKRASCHGRVPSFLYVLHELAEKHFYHEEFIMVKRLQSDQSNDYFEKHKRAHKLVLDAFHQAIIEADAHYEHGKIAEAYKSLHAKVMHELKTHANEYDDPFIKSMLKNLKL